MESQRFYSWYKDFYDDNQIIIYRQEKEDENSYNCISEIVGQLKEENESYKFHLKKIKRYKQKIWNI